MLARAHCHLLRCLPVQCRPGAMGNDGV